MDEGEDLRILRVFDYFDSGEDFYKIRDWPRYVREMALQRHKNYRDRYRLFLFFVANGLDPHTAYEWVCVRDYVNGKPIYEVYDASANQQMNAAIKAAQDGTLLVGRQWFDMRLRRVVKDVGY